ncbi:MAG: FAD-binding oxidoreductase [Alphaproteobacteria bacterium]|nr:FAD-binding oxidoreductase [Alphaproteobacteria bacterium]
MKRLRPKLAVVGSEPSRQGPQRFDVVVVGGGLMGAALAYELVVRGQRVALVEQDTLGAGTSGTTFSWINATSKADDEAYFRLNAEGLARYRHLATLWGERSLGLWSNGSMHWADDEHVEQRSRLDRAAAAMARWGYSIVDLDRARLIDLEPRLSFAASARGFIALADGWVEAAKLVRLFAAKAAEHGAEIVEKARVTAIRADGEPVTLTTEARTFLATRVVLAAGIATASLAALAMRSLEWRLPLRSVPGLLIDTPPSPWRWVRRVVYSPESGGLHARPTSAGGMILGSDDTDAAVANGDEQAAIAATRTLLARFARLAPGFDAADVMATASPRIGLRPMPADDRPIVGPLPDTPSVYAMVTHSGVTLGPLLAGLLAEEIVSGTASTTLAPYRPSRFANRGHAATSVQT